MNKAVLLSGIQPSGLLTLGNYLGAMRNWLQLQADHDCLFMLVDLHAITNRQNPNELRERCYSFLAQYLALGLDPKQSAIFVQSHVPEHAQLAWLLNCYAYMGELNRMTQFKDKSRKQEDNINVGLFTYPVLMAADILLYQSALVPVGEDQKQHLELTRDIALRFNALYGEIFTIPMPYIPKMGARVMSLQEPNAKMSKSDSNMNATIALLDSPDTVTKKLKKAVTDSLNPPQIQYDPDNQMGVSNLLSLLAAMSNQSIDFWVDHFVGKGYGHLKLTVAEHINETFKPVQSEYTRLMNDRTYLNDVLRESALRARQKAQITLKKVHDAIGLIG